MSDQMLSFVRGSNGICQLRIVFEFVELSELDDLRNLHHVLLDVARKLDAAIGLASKAAEGRCPDDPCFTFDNATWSDIESIVMGRTVPAPCEATP